MNIVILDDYTLCGKDLNWNDLKKFGNIKSYKRTPKNLVVKRTKNADVILSNKCLLLKNELDQLPNLKYIGILATGYNVVDLNECKKRNIVVTNVPAYATNSVAQSIFAHILNIANGVCQHSLSVRDGHWSNAKDFSYSISNITEIYGKTLGFIGYGNIGRETAKIAKAFGMNVIAFAPSKKENSSDLFASFKNLDFILENSDIISLCCPLNDKTKEIISEKNISKMKKGSWLINTSRGPLINEPNLANALKSKHIAFAGLDVLSSEPPKKNNPLLKLKNCYITPHNAWASFEARNRMMNIVIKNVSAWLNANPQNVI